MRAVSKRTFLKLLGLGGLLTSGRTIAVVPGSKQRILHGPMLGYVTNEEAAVWVRTSEACDIAVEVSERRDFKDARIVAGSVPPASAGFAATLVLRGLAPGRDYYYRVLVNGEQDPYRGDRPPLRLRTAPAPGSAAAFTVAFGSCARYAKDSLQRIWHAVDEANPDLFFWLGDNIYGDSAETQTLVAEYARQRGVLSYQSIAGRIPQLAIWDDHDFAFNDSDKTNPIRHDALAIFRDWWANPAYGESDNPGVYFRYTYGGVDFFFLDVRFHRDPNSAPDGPRKTMLGARQKQWLEEGLRDSDAPFKVLVSGSGWTMAKGVGGDSWASCRHERDALFDFIREEKIGGVVLVSGDTHVGELNCIPGSERGGYDLYDLVSSPLAQPPSDSWITRTPELRIRQAYFSTPNFGLLEFDMTGEPTLRFNVIDPEGNRAWAPFELKAADLRNGVSTWREKLDDVSRERHERAANGMPYYQ